MREILELDFSSIFNFTLIGVDIDQGSLLLASKQAEKTGLTRHLKLMCEDAWTLPYDAELDLITSCGLNIYVSDRTKVLDLYRQFFKALKPKGKLIIGFLTYPPDESVPSEWNLVNIQPEDLLLEKIIYKDILSTHWRNFRTSEEFEQELKLAGFSEIGFFYDSRNIFPTVIATK